MKELPGNEMRDIADRFGTPLYVYDGEVFRETYQRVRDLLDPRVRIHYSAKANPNVSVCAVFRALGAGFEVSSLAELETARRAGVAPGDIIFVGPGKSADELRACCELGIHAIVCESLDELAALDTLAPPERTQVLIRVNPGFSGKGTRLSMGGKPRQFGVDQEALLAAGPALRRLRHVRLAGIHAYLGTRILEASGVVHNTSGILAAALELSDTLDFPLRTVDIGGGFGVPYFDNEKDLDLEATVQGVNTAVADFLDRSPDTAVVTELGRYLAGWGGMYVVGVRYVKESRGEWFVITDGGTHHHMAAVGIGSFVKRNFPIRSLTGTGTPDRRYNVVGPLCTPNDVIAKQVPLPEVRPGDLIAVERSGAYGPTASPVLFLSHGYPAEVLVLDGEAHLVRSRDTVDDLLRQQHLVVR
jgi:diaminopimelate decarboxylase